MVEHEPLVERVDVGRENLQPLAGQCPREPMEHAAGDRFPRGHRDRHGAGRRLPACADEHAVRGQSRQLSQFLEHTARLSVMQVGERQLPGEPDDTVVGIAARDEFVEHAAMTLRRHRRALAVEGAERAKVEFAEQVSLPPRPDARSDGADIGRGEHREHPQHLRRADVAGEPYHETVVGGIATKRLMGHHEMFEHEKFDDLSLVGRQAESGRHVAGHPRPQLAVVLDESLAEVVDQQCQEYGLLAVDLPPRIAEPAGFILHFGSPFNGHDAVLVDGVFMVVVELQQMPGVGELGDQDLKRPHLVQPAQCVSQAPRLGEEPEEPLPGGVGRRQTRSLGAHRGPGGVVDRHVIDHCQFHQPHDRIEAARHLWQAACHGRHIVRPDTEQPVDPVAENGGDEGPRCAGPAEAGDQRLDHLGHATRVPEVVAHERLHAEHPVPRLDAACLGDAKLLISREIVGRLAGREMKVVSQPRQKFGRVAKRVGICPRQATHEREMVKRRLAPEHTAQPSHQLNVAEAARRPLDVWLEQRDGLAILARFLATCLDEGPGIPRLPPLDESPEPRFEPCDQIGISSQWPALQERAEDRRVGRGQAAGFVHGPHALAHVSAGVEEILQQPLGGGGDRTGRLPVVEQHEVDVGKRRHLATTVAAMRDERCMATERGGVRRGQIIQGGVPETDHYLIAEVGGEAAGLNAWSTGGMLRGDPFAKRRQFSRCSRDRGAEGGRGGQCGTVSHVAGCHGSSATSARRFASRASTKSRSPKRFRYSIALAGIVVSSRLARVTTRRSARRQTVRATWRAAASGVPVGRMKHLSGSIIASCRSISASRYSTWPVVIRSSTAPGVANWAPRSKSSHCTRRRNASNGPAVGSVRTSPRWLLSSSTVPKASIRAWSFDTRGPPKRPVSPASPVFV